MFVVVAVVLGKSVFLFVLCEKKMVTCTQKCIAVTDFSAKKSAPLQTDVMPGIKQTKTSWEGFP